MTEPFPARIHVLLATETPAGLVIRRGPAKQVCTLLWDRTTDTFQLGQWLKGRIDAGISDITPDGKYWVYFASQGRTRSQKLETWTAVARVPYLKALTFIPECGTWGGGGYFTRDGQHWVHGTHLHRTLPENGELPEVCESLYGNLDRENHPVPDRLERGGWVPTEQAHTPEGDYLSIWEKPVEAGWVLRRITRVGGQRLPGRGPAWDRHQLIGSASGAEVDFPDWEWADLDGERLVWAEGGWLYAGRVTGAGLQDQRLLHDFNDLKFEAIAAPY